MSPSSLDFVVRSLTTSLLAFTILAVAVYEVVHTGSIDSQFGAFVGLVLGFYFGAHVSQNGSAVRSPHDKQPGAGGGADKQRRPLTMPAATKTERP